MGFLYFRDKAESIIKAAEKNKIILPFHNEKSNLFEKDIDADLYKLEISSFANSLSTRQIECCSLLLKGKTSKEIAELLCLSVRTIEYYIGNVKLN